MKNIFFKSAIMAVLITMAGAVLFSQTPTHYPTGKNPVEFDLGSVLLYIVFPVVLVLAWLLIRSRKKKKEEEEQGQDSESADQG